MLDTVIDLINRKTGGGTKYINQRDKDFVFSSLQEDKYDGFSEALQKAQGSNIESIYAITKVHYARKISLRIRSSRSAM